MEKKNNLPLGWKYVKLSEIAIINPPKPNTVSDDLDVSFIPMKCVEELTGQIDLNNIKKYHEVKKGFTSFSDGDIIFAKITPCMENGKIAIVHDLKNGIGFGSTEFHVIRMRDQEISQRLYFWYLIQDNFRTNARQEMKGTVGQLRVSSDYLNEVLIPLPPLNEQKRIVTKIDELFSELDNIKNLLNNTKEQLTQFKQSLLKSVFEKKPQKDVEKITKNKIGDYAKIQNGYAFKSSWFKNNGIRLVRNINIGHGIINWENPVFLDEMQAKQFSRFKLFENDIVISMDRPIIKSGLKLARLTKNDLPALLLQRVGKFKILNTAIDDDYFYLWLQSNTFLNSLNPGRSLGVPHISATELENIRFKILLPSISEQKKITSNITCGFSIIENIGNITNSMLLQLDILRSSILKLTFEGKLIPQDPNDEPASELLKRIKSQK